MARRIHHLALGAHDVARVAAFYAKLGLDEVARHTNSDGTLRAVWLDAGGSLLMIEKTRAPRSWVENIGAGPFLVALSVSAEERSEMERVLEGLGASIESRTDYTSYARDPEGNRIALSHYPVDGQVA
jgi:catechol 2,3-dioxygenase-like lactoylglutathione lyase family enzyme